MENRRAFFFLILSMALGVLATIAAARWLEGQRELPDVAARPDASRVTIAKADLPVGAVLEQGALAAVEWPAAYLPQGTHSDPAQLAGRVLRRPLAEGEPVLESALMPVGAEGGLVSVIDPTLRALSVRVDPVVGVAGFVKPGSHVDVLVTLRREQGSYSKVILQDVQVLAIDQKLEGPGTPDPELVQVVTLEVSPAQAEKLTFATHEGKLQLALRNPDDREVVETSSVGVADVLGVKPVKRVARAPVSRTQVEVVKGADLSVESF